MNQIALPWPPPALRPNARSPGAWRFKQTAAKKYRADCLLLARVEKFRAAGSSISIIANPPDRRRRDLDNVLASCKQGIDALCEASGLDDYTFDHVTIIRGGPVKGGQILVTIGGE